MSGAEDPRAGGWSAPLAILAASALSFGIFAPRLGFYCDDWYLVAVGAGARGFRQAVQAYAAAGVFASRPVSILHFAACSLAGLHPLPYQLIALSLECLAMLLFYVFLSRLLAWPSLAGLAACLALVYPNHCATHHVFSCSQQSLALCLALASLVLHLRWTERRGAALRAAGALCYGLSLLTYESGAFLPLVLLTGLLARGASRGEPLPSAARRALPVAASFAAVFAAVFLWQWVAVRWLGGGNPKSLGASGLHFVLSFRTSVAELSFKTLGLCARTLPAAWRTLDGRLLALLPPLCLLGAAGLRPSLGAPEEGRGPALRVAAFTGAAAFAAAVLPYALSRDYMPNMYGIASRSGAALSMSGGLLLAAGLAALESRRPAVGRALLALVLAAFTWTNWHTARAWAESSRLQESVLESAAPKARDLPPGATVLLAGVPTDVNAALNPVIVFGATWDFSSALGLAAGRTDLAADVVTDKTTFHPDGVERDGHRIPYRGLFLYRHDRGTMVPLSGPPDEPLLPGRLFGPQL